MTDISNILEEAEKNRRQDRARSAQAVTTSTPASTGDNTVNDLPANIVLTDANGKIPASYLPAGGGGSTSASYEHTQATAAAVWTINHQLGGYPPVVVLDTDGVQVQAEVRYPDANHATVTFGAPHTGVAHLSL